MRYAFALPYRDSQQSSGNFSCHGGAVMNTVVATKLVANLVSKYRSTQLFFSFVYIFASTD